MPAYLLLPGLQGNFRVAEQDAQEIRDTLRGAIEKGTTVVVHAELGDNPLTRPTITVNGASLAWFTVIQVDDATTLGL